MKTKVIFLLLSTITLHLNAQQSTLKEIAKNKKGLVKVAIYYTNDQEKTFDMDYYVNKHMPMVADLFGESCKLYEIDKGIAGRTPEEPIPFVAIGYFYFDSLKDYESAFGSNTEKILGDIPNYTNIQPILQISKVVHR